MAPVLNRFRPNNYQPKRKVLNFINKPNKQTPFERLQPAFYKTKVIQPNVQVSEPVKEAVAEPVLEKPTSIELSKGRLSDDTFRPQTNKYVYLGRCFRAQRF